MSFNADGEPAHAQSDWLGYRWCAWMPLMAAHPLALGQMPLSPGLYRVRRVDRRDQLEWIGWAEQGLRETIERLSRQVHLPVEPYDDAASPARVLWQLRRGCGVSFEVSGAAVDTGDGRRCADLARAAYGDARPHDNEDCT